MLIKIVYSGQESEDWISLTKKLHRILLDEKPDEVVVHIEDLYPDCPEVGTVIRLDFNCFTAIAREFVLEDNRQRKEMARHIDKRSLEEVLKCEDIVDYCTPDYYYLLNERRRVICNAIRSLTATQRRRYLMHFEDDLSLQEIANIEGVAKSTIDDSIQAAQRKIKKFC